MAERGPAGGLKKWEMWRAAVLARDNRISEWPELAELLSAEVGRTITAYQLRESARKAAGHPKAAPGTRIAAQALRATREWAKTGCVGDPPELARPPPYDINKNAPTTPK